MDGNELRVRVAEAAEWTRIWYRGAKADHWLAPGELPKYPTGPITGIMPYPRPCRAGEEPEDPLDYMPDWPNDLNACAELRKGLTEIEEFEYGRQLVKLACGTYKGTGLNYDHAYQIANATAEQHCRAYIAAKGVKYV